MLLCEEGELADGVYFDAATARSVRVEHVAARIVSTEEAEEKLRSQKVCFVQFTPDPRSLAAGACPAGACACVCARCTAARSGAAGAGAERDRL